MEDYDIPYTRKQQEHHKHEMRSEYNQEIIRRISRYRLEQTRYRDLVVHVGPYHKINDDREGQKV